jgi:hypothetical protein
MALTALGTLQLVEPDFDRGACDTIELRFRTNQMERAVNVGVMLRRGEAQGR